MNKTKMYSFYYPRYGVRQRKVLIPHDVFLQWKNMPVDTKEEVREAKAFLKGYTGGWEWFTDKSLLFESLSTGYMEIDGLRIDVKHTELSPNDIYPEDVEIL